MEENFSNSLGNRLQHRLCEIGCPIYTKTRKDFIAKMSKDKK